MLFAISAAFNSAPPAHPQECDGDFNEHLAQKTPRVRLAARTRSEAGVETGIFVILEAIDYAAAQTFLESSPYQKADLYASCTISELDVEVGTLN